MELIEGSETSANYNLTPGKYPEENIQLSDLQTKQKKHTSHEKGSSFKFRLAIPN